MAGLVAATLAAINSAPNCPSGAQAVITTRIAGPEINFAHLGFGPVGVAANRSLGARRPRGAAQGCSRAEPEVGRPLEPS